MTINKTRSSQQRKKMKRQFELGEQVVITGGSRFLRGCVGTYQGVCGRKSCNVLVLGGLYAMGGPRIRKVKVSDLEPVHSIAA